jgi:hypothetical protein
MSNTRALKATRALLAADQAAATGSPLQHIEAIKLEPSSSKREEMIAEAAKTLALDDNAQDAAEEIIKAFFTEPPRADSTTDDPDRVRLLKRTLHRALLRRYPALCKGEPSDLAPGPDPNRGGAVEGVQVGPHPRDDRRSVAELETAARVLGLAVRMNLEISDVVEKAAIALRQLAPQVGEDESARIALTKLADDLDDAVSAAGSMDIGKNTEEQKLFEAAMRAGHDSDRVLQLSREHDHLSGSNGGRGIRMSKSAYIERNLRRSQ